MTPKRALGQASVNTTAQRKVAFDSVPAPAKEGAKKNKTRVKKIAGKHACNVREELFLASVAAFERQLTHRCALENQLNTR